MQYLLLIYEREADWNAMNEKEKGTIFQEYMAFTQGIMKSGHRRAGDALQPVSTATTVRMRNGKTVTTDGPFAETREQLGGYFLVEAKNLDEAINIAGQIPGARKGTVEIGPLVDLPNLRWGKKTGRNNRKKGGKKLMPSTTPMNPVPKGMLWTGRVLSALVTLFMLFDGTIKVIKLPAAMEGTAKLGYPLTEVFPLGVVALVCTLLYAIPRTAVLGA